MVKEMVIGMGMPIAGIAQEPLVKEQTWGAILVTDGGNGPPPPPDEFKFPWWLVGIIGVGVVAIATKKELGKP